MNKKANRRAFFVCLCIGLMYGSVVFRLADKISIARVWGGKDMVSSSMAGSKAKMNADISLPEVPASVLESHSEEERHPLKPLTEQPHAPPERLVVRIDQPNMEPGFFIALPLVAYALKQGLIERDGLIFLQKEGYNNVTCKKPIDILRDKDEHGLKVIARLIGKRQSLDLLRKEGVSLDPNIDSERIIAGTGYTLDKDKILSLYEKYVSEDFSDLFPFVWNGIAVTKTKKGFEFSQARGVSARERERAEEQEWTMPNVINLTMRAAIEKLAPHTSKIRVYGNGFVVEQTPRAFERTKGETECIIYGRTAR